jgi:glutamate/tyrosine decarboxylase-like PLP-dependent enzyme
MNLSSYLPGVVDSIASWQANWDDAGSHPALMIDPDRLREVLDEYLHRLEGNYPFFHPRYAGQMLKPPHAAAVIGYLAALLINPNNHALDGGPPTSAMEKEVVRQLAGLFRWPEETLGHLTSSGTIANLEALWVARQCHPTLGIAFSREAHYTHARMCEVLRVEGVAIPTDDGGRMRMDRLEEALQSGGIGPIVATAGTTGCGVVDPIDEVLDLARRHGVRVHIDGAYGGFFAIHAWDEAAGVLDPATARRFRAIASCDSLVIDPHKHGLQPYGCGAVLFRDPGVGAFYKHDSPYTYFTSDALHLGEISLECSRAGAAAGALWMTLQLLPLHAADGLGPILAASLRAARAWTERIKASANLDMYLPPELDIVTYFPKVHPRAAEAIDRASADAFKRLMEADEPVYLSLYSVPADRIGPAAPNDEGRNVRIFRSVLMKPEHELWVDRLCDAIEDAALMAVTGTGLAGAARAGRQQ